MRHSSLSRLLPRNGITFLPENVFSVLSSLKVLFVPIDLTAFIPSDLSNNAITKLSATVFASLNALERLFVADFISMSQHQGF
jgi:hypothetical protein